MKDIPEKKLLMLNQIGLIPGPHELFSNFIERVEYSLHLKEHLPKELKDTLSREPENSSEILTTSLNQLKENYDCAPAWPPIFFSNYKLPFWLGGCAWIFQMKKDSPTSALIQLRKAFNKSKTYLGIYQCEELLTHELSHIGRMMFQEPKFEELIAYRTAKSGYRRWLGPLVQSSMESTLFLLLLFMLLVFDVFLISADQSDAYTMALWLKTIPLVLVLAALIRLWKKQKTFKACIENLKECVKYNMAEAVAYRLQDDEILFFSQATAQEIHTYATEKKNEELRWKVIFNAYFIPLSS